MFLKIIEIIAENKKSEQYPHPISGKKFIISKAVGLQPATLLQVFTPIGSFQEFCSYI